MTEGHCLSEALLPLRLPASSWDRGAVELHLSPQQCLLQVVRFVFILSLHTLLTLEFWMQSTLTLLPSLPPTWGIFRRSVCESLPLSVTSVAA